MSHFSDPIYDVVTNPRNKNGYLRIDREIFRDCEITADLYLVLKDPRPSHMRHLSHLSASELKDREIIRKTLAERAEESKRWENKRNAVFGHLWRDLAVFLDRPSALNLGRTYPAIIPQVHINL